MNKVFNCFLQCFYSNNFISEVILGFNLCKYMLLTNYLVYHYCKTQTLIGHVLIRYPATVAKLSVKIDTVFSS